MPDFTHAFAISASGMALERLRLEVAATNLANAHTTAGAGGQTYRPLRVIAQALGSGVGPRFMDHFDRSPSPADLLKGIGSVEVVPSTTPPRFESDPGNPDADAQGLVTLPQVNPVEETLTAMTALRAYEANIRILNAGKAMAIKTLEIGART